MTTLTNIDEAVPKTALNKKELLLCRIVEQGRINREDLDAGDRKRMTAILKEYTVARVAIAGEINWYAATPFGAEIYRSLRRGSTFKKAFRNNVDEYQIVITSKPSKKKA